jgi:Holliday junction resolvase RusA-like endonuclease
MEIIKETFFPITPRGALRATQDMFWLTKITEDQAKALDSKWKKKVTGIGEVWVTYKKDKFGILKEYARKSAPSYERMRRYLLAQYNVVDELKDMAHRFGFIMPEDDFAIECRMPMPKSWTKKKKIEMAYQLHKQKPDADNAFKLLIDVMFKDGSTSGRFRNDSCVSSFVCVKYYVPDGVDTGYNIIEFEKGFISGIIPNLK